MRTRVLCSVMVSVLAVGCARNEEDGDLTAAEARSAGDALGNGVEDAAKTYGPMQAVAADTTCTTLTGDTTDPDLDAIPADATLTYDCTTTALGYTGTLTGTQHVIDDQPSTLAWAFTGTADMHASLTAGGGASITSDWSGDLVGTQESALGPFALVRTLGVETLFASGGDLDPRTTTVTEDNDWTVTFTPQATWTPGGLIVTGSLEVTGTWTVTVDDKTAAATLSTPTPLTVDPACETLITAGTVTGTYPRLGGGTGTITVTWTGCGQRGGALGS